MAEQLLNSLLLVSASLMLAVVVVAASDSKKHALIALMSLVFVFGLLAVNAHRDALEEGRQEAEAYGDDQ